MSQLTRTWGMWMRLCWECFLPAKTAVPGVCPEVWTEPAGTLISNCWGFFRPVLRKMRRTIFLGHRARCLWMLRLGMSYGAAYPEQFLVFWGQWPWILDRKETFVLWIPPTGWGLRDLLFSLALQLQNEWEESPSTAKYRKLFQGRLFPRLNLIKGLVLCFQEERR